MMWSFEERLLQMLLLLYFACYDATLELFILFIIALAENMAELKAERKEAQKQYDDLLAEQKAERVQRDKEAAEAQRQFEAKQKKELEEAQQQQKLQVEAIAHAAKRA